MDISIWACRSVAPWTRAHRLANLLAGNSQDTATLELTLTGPTLQFNATTCIAIAGASLSPTLNGHVRQ